MSNLSEKQITELQTHLEGAVIGCAERGLYQSSKWVAELLNSLPKFHEDSDSDTDPDEPSDAPEATRSRPPQDRRETLLQSKEYHKYLLAKSFFDCREYDRCTAVFLPNTKPRVPTVETESTPKKRVSTKGKDKATALPSPQEPQIEDTRLPKLSQKALFFAIYSKYLAGEKRKDEESEMILGPADGGVTVNKELTSLIALLGNWLQERETQKLNGGGWLEYLYGILLAKNKSEDLARRWFLKSVHIYPYNWGVWQELSNLVDGEEELAAILEQLPRNLMTIMFIIYTNQELGQYGEQIHTALDQVETYFPHSAFLKSQRALLFYHAKQYEESCSIFSSILQTDPYRLDSLDNYSNVLHVSNKRPLLAFLAQLAAQTDKFRPETCCIIGNYYSRNSEHEKAVMYFRRALTLDRNFISAWTLMGQEYVEMKNTHAALESYRRAIDVNRKDYRAWHGLGITYELLDMYSYALFYHQRAAALRPFDPKTWQGVANCFARVGKTQNAIRAYKRALIAGSYYVEGSTAGSFGEDGGPVLAGGVLDPESLYALATLYEKTGNMRECAAYMELVLAQEEGPGGPLDGDDDDLGGLLNNSQLNNSQLSATAGNAPNMSAGGQAAGGQGVGVTATTSRARMWLARWEFINQNYQRANELANELCQDGVEVEDAKALIRDIRSRVESERLQSSERQRG
ncbi:anaphase-promoting complex subunit CDC23 [Microthyrium microscopicum]|uniref:Anaphase-promoting complex subunit CDC23 n=1 Tax=Microthyrium microscopicum TaxID=703497 RepID=A0A6A6TW82_9PEZI|nr:anaphase-promoting complex subunit CDC23 [Microthyrium microscopicum]